MAENSNILITVTADDSGAITKINKLGQEINTAGDASKSWIQQLATLKTQLASVDPNSQQWAELALQYKELGGSSKVVSASVEDLKSKVASFNDAGAATVSNVEGLKAQLRTLQTEFDKVAASAPGGGRYQQLSKEIASVKSKISDASNAVNNEAVPAFQGFTGNISDAKDKLLALDFKGATESFKSLGDNVKNFKAQDLVAGLNNIKAGFISLGKALIANPLFAVAAAIAAAVAYREELLSLIDGVSSADQEALATQQAKAAAAKKELDDVGAQEQILKRQGLTEKEILQVKIDKGKAAINEQKAIISTLELQKQQQIEAATRNRDILKGILQFLSIPLTALLAGVDLLTEGLNKAGLISDETFGKIGNLRDKFTTSIAELVFDPAEVAAKGDESIAAAKDTLKQLENQQAGFQNSVDAINQQAADKAKQLAEQRLAAEKEVQQAIDASKEEQFQATLTAEEKELRQVALKYNALKEKAGQNKELQKQLREQELAEQQAITDKYFEESLAKAAENDAKKLEQDRAAAAKANEERIAREDALFALEQELELNKLSANEAKKQKAINDLVAEYDAKFALAKGNAELEAELTRQRDAELAKINQEYRDAEKAEDDKAQKEKFDAFVKTSEMITKSATDGLNTLSSLNELFSGKSEKSQKKAFERNKKLQIAQATVTTYQNAVAAASSQYVTGDPSSVVRAVLAAASAVAAGLANIAKIKATSFSSPAPSGGGGGGGGGGELASQGVAAVSGPPEFNPLAALNLTQPQQIQPAYVLASDIASSMEARSKVEDLSRL